MSNNSVAKIITDKLTENFAPQHLEIIDQSHLHAGHAGAKPEGETHFSVIIISDKFAGQNLVSRHRAVNEALQVELKGPIHALAIKAQTPQEAEAKKV